MREQVLRDFFLGALSAGDLRDDLAGALVPASRQVTHHPITDMDVDFEVRAVHLEALCTAVVDGDLEPWMLEPIGFALVASDRFWWDGDAVDGQRVAEAAYDWASPVVNYALTRETAARFRHRLRTGTFTRADLWSER